MCTRGMCSARPALQRWYTTSSVVSVRPCLRATVTRRRPHRHPRQTQSHPSPATSSHSSVAILVTLYRLVRWKYILVLRMFYKLRYTLTHSGWSCSTSSKVKIEQICWAWHPNTGAEFKYSYTYFLPWKHHFWDLKVSAFVWKYIYDGSILFENVILSSLI